VQTVLAPLRLPRPPLDILKQNIDILKQLQHPPPNPHKAHTHTVKAMPSVYELKKTLSLKAGEVLGKGFVVKDIEVRFAGGRGRGGVSFLECPPARRESRRATGYWFTPQIACPWPLR